MGLMYCELFGTNAEIDIISIGLLKIEHIG